MSLATLLAHALVTLAPAGASPTTAAALGHYLGANAAVRGATAEAKRYAGASACGPVVVREMELDTFRATIDCGKPDSGASTVLGDGAAASVEVIGSFFNGGSGVLIERIEFHYGG